MSSFGRFLAENKIWWIMPLVIVLGLVAWLLIAGPGEPGDAADSPFQYDTY